MNFSQLTLSYHHHFFQLTLGDQRAVKMDFLGKINKKSGINDEAKFWEKNLVMTLKGDIVADIPNGTLFQQKVWREIQRIPWGQVMTYRELAERIGHPNSYRAVANACGANPLLLFIPCHRVVGKSSLGGYRGGRDLKLELLKRERGFSLYE
jgi:O-6-methylguanine DNA methyltransferase